MAEAELVWGDGLLLNNVPVASGMAHVWPSDFVHAYMNTHSAEATILCINRPRFDPMDEILFNVQLADLPDATPFGKRYFGIP
jgi:hypothetical protein